jgi:hypothetical protein
MRFNHGFLPRIPIALRNIKLGIGGYGEGRPFRLYIHTEYGALRMRSSIRGTNSQLYNINGTTILNQNQWYHIAYSKEQTRARLFLNGRLEGSVNMSYPPTRITNFSIGALRQGISVTNSFARQIDEVVVYTPGNTGTSILFTPYS